MNINDQSSIAIQSIVSEKLEKEDHERFQSIGHGKNDSILSLLSKTLSDSGTRKEFRKPSLWEYGHFVRIGLFAALSVAMLVACGIFTLASEKKSTALRTLEERLTESTARRAAILRTWIDGHVLLSKHLTDSSVVVSFINDLALTRPDKPLPRFLVDQRPYLQETMIDFAKRNDLLRASIVDRSGRVLLSSPGPVIDISSVLAEIDSQARSWDKLVSSFRSFGPSKETVVVDIMIPIPNSQNERHLELSLDAVLILTVSMNDILIESLHVSQPNAEHESVSIIQTDTDMPRESKLVRWKNHELNIQIMPKWILEKDLSLFNKVFPDGNSYYVYGHSFLHHSWTIVHAVNENAVLSSISKFVLRTSLLIITIGLILSLLIVGIWRRQNNKGSLKFKNLNHAINEVISCQNDFLNNVTNSMGDWLIVTNKEKKVIYANHSFCEAIGSDFERISGRSWHEILPKKQEKMSGYGGYKNAFFDKDKIAIKGQDHFISEKSSEIRDQRGIHFANMAIIRDESALVQREIDHDRVIRQTIEALINAIECHDPYLLYYTTFLRNHALAVARQFNLSHIDYSGLALAASLSQVGKAFSRDKPSDKQNNRKPQSSDCLRLHLKHANHVLGGINFGSPVLAFIEQMHERLDGSGYPNGLADKQISLPGRILAVTDVFCAKKVLEPKIRHSTSSILYKLTEARDRYDIRVTAALAKILASGQRIGQEDDDQRLPDYQVWLKKSQTMNL